MTDETDLNRSARALSRARAVLVLTGAGISAESGIPTFRGAGGLWEGFRAEELATPQAFAADPARVWRWYRWRQAQYGECEPNPGHAVIAQMEGAFDAFLLATQNVDGLHHRAGNREMVELHGTITRTRCSRCQRLADWPEPIEEGEDPVPRCGFCEGLMRPHILWFGERYWTGTLERAYEFAHEADVCLVVGTSAQVWAPAQMALLAQQQGAFLIDVNPGATDISFSADVHLMGPAGEMLPELWERAKRSPQDP